MFKIEAVPQEFDPEVRAWLIGLQKRIYDAISVLEPEQLILDKLSVSPDKPSDGEVIYADGTNYDPGSGVGIYYFDGTSYVKLG